LRHADKALYRAKKLGRNRAELAASLEPASPSEDAVEAAPLKSGHR
jgi:hypothetical protein